MSLDFLKIWRRCEAGALTYFANQLESNKSTEIKDLEQLLPQGGTLAEYNAAIEQRVSPLARGLVDQLLDLAESAGEDEVVHDAPAFVDKVVALARSEAAKLSA